MSWDVWGVPLIILAVGLAVGAVVSFLVWREGAVSPSAAAETSSEELRARHVGLIDQIRELDADQDKLHPEDYARRREVLITEAAQVLRALESPQVRTSMASQAAGSRGVRGQGAVVWVGVSVAFFALLGVLISQNAVVRQDGQVMTGGMGGGGGESAAAEAAMQELLAARRVRQKLAQDALQANPADLEALNILTYDALLYRELDAAMQHVEAARAVNAQDAGVLIHLAILQMSVGMNDRAEEGLVAAAAIRADDPKLLLWRGFLRARQGRQAEAEADLMAAASRASWEEERMLAFGLLRDLRTAPPTSSASSASSASSPGGEGGGAVRVSGEVVAGEGIAVPSGAVLFVYVRRAEQAAGPPVAAVRFPAEGVPLSFAIGDAQMLPMAGGVWPEAVWLQARIDLDGNAATREEGAPVSEVVGPLSAGTSGVSLVLR